MVCSSAPARTAPAAGRSARRGNPAAPTVPACGGCGRRRAGRGQSGRGRRPRFCRGCPGRRQWRRSAPVFWARFCASSPARRASRPGRPPGRRLPETWPPAPRRKRTDPAMCRNSPQCRWNGGRRQRRALPAGCPPQNRWSRQEDPGWAWGVPLSVHFAAPAGRPERPRRRTLSHGIYYTWYNCKKQSAARQPPVKCRQKSPCIIMQQPAGDCH